MVLKSFLGCWIRIWHQNYKINNHESNMVTWKFFIRTSLKWPHSLRALRAWNYLFWTNAECTCADFFIIPSGVIALTPCFSLFLSRGASKAKIVSHLLLFLYIFVFNIFILKYFFSTFYFRHFFFKHFFPFFFFSFFFVPKAFQQWVLQIAGCKFIVKITKLEMLDSIWVPTFQKTK